MNFWKLCDVALILAAMVVMFLAEKKQPERTRQALMWSFCTALGLVTPFALIEALSVFGLRLFDVSWAFAPLDILAGLCVVFLIVLFGKKLFGVPDPKLPEQ